MLTLDVLRDGMRFQSGLTRLVPEKGMVPEPPTSGREMCAPSRKLSQTAHPRKARANSLLATVSSESLCAQDRR